MAAELKYSKLIAFRMTHTDPRKLDAFASFFKNEVAEVFKQWVEAVPDPKPTIEGFMVGADDFPMRVGGES